MSNEPNPPQISVIMAVYNAQPYLAQAIQSILTQTFTDFEFIIIDDGSTDGSSDVLAQTAAVDSRLIIVRQENAGLTRACQIGVNMAKGTYIARMDTDDVAFPDRFARQVAALTADPTIVALGTQVQLIDTEGRALKVMQAPLSHQEIDRQHISGKGQSRICHPTVMMRTDAVRQVGNYNVKFQTSQDIDLFLRLAEIGKVANLPEALLSYRQHAASVGYAKRARQVSDAWQAVQDAAKRRGIVLKQTNPPFEGPHRSKTDIWRMWGWWALSAGHTATARHYAWRILYTAPLSRKNWHFALIALRGY